MEKKQRTLHTSNNGDEWIFDCTEFAKAVDNKQLAIQEETGDKCSRSQVFRNLAFELTASISIDAQRDQSVRALTDSMKNWYKGTNGPSLDMEEIYKMEKYLGCNLLMPRPKAKENRNVRSKNSMNTSTLHTNMTFDSPVKVRLDVSEAKRNAARKVYGVVCDLIRMQQKMLYNYFTAGFPIMGTVNCVPEGFPIYSDVQNDIRKYGFDLPRDLIDSTMRLVQRIYGWWHTQLEEAELTNGDEYERRFEQWSGGPMDKDDFFGWCDFINEETLESYDLLDEIFDSYIG